MRYLSLVFLPLVLLACGDPEDSDDTSAEEMGEEEEGEEGEGGEVSGTRVDDILALMGDDMAGDPLFQTNCAGCHAADGSGASGPNVQGRSGAGTVSIILTGEDSMPSFDQLADQEIADIVAFVSSL